MRAKLITLEDGRKFPSIDGQEALAWDISLYMTLNEEKLGYQKARAVASMMNASALQSERREALKASFNEVFGRNAQKLLNLIEDEFASRNRS